MNTKIIKYTLSLILLLVSQQSMAYFMTYTGTTTNGNGALSDSHFNPSTSTSTSIGYLTSTPDGPKPITYSTANANASLGMGTLKAFSYAESNSNTYASNSTANAQLREKISFNTGGLLTSDWTITLLGSLTFGANGVDGQTSPTGSETAWVNFSANAYINAYDVNGGIYQDAASWAIHQGPGTLSTDIIPSSLTFDIPLKYVTADLYIDVNLQSFAGSCLVCSDGSGGIFSQASSTADASNTGTLSLAYTDGVEYTSESNIFLTERAAVNVPEPSSLFLLAAGLLGFIKTQKKYVSIIK